jgi:cytochrome c peroxidase
MNGMTTAGWLRDRFVRISSAALSRTLSGSALALPLIAGGVLTLQTQGALPPVPVPPENPITENKRVLGKILFFDEQLSTSNVVSCASCHVSANAGADPRLARHPGPDNVLNTPDDILGSPGVIKSDELNNFDVSAIFGLRPQITGRAANSNINAMYAPDLFWDGRGRSQFIDPETGQVAIQNGGGLESQAAGPPVNDVEMAHANMNWLELNEKLARVRALDLSTNIPADVASVLNTTRSYRELFRRAFGDETISARRIAFALATYQRTLVSDQTPWDAFQAGNANALTLNQQQGLQAFLAVGPNTASCSVCHTPPLFANTVNNPNVPSMFRNLGLRPNNEDIGRQAVTGVPGDIGRFKVPSLRNAVLKRSFMHNGQFANIGQVLGFYAGARNIQPPPPNRDPVLNGIALPPNVAGQINDFISNGLLDPRVRDQTFPFDRATLFTNRPVDQATIVPNTGTVGSGGVVPRVVVQAPPMIGNREFRVGLDGALGGTTARLGVSSLPPVNGRITPQQLFDAQDVEGTGNGVGFATLHWPLLPGRVTPGQVLFVQWFVDDPGAAGGQAVSQVGRLPIFCGSAGCPSFCSMSDFNGDGFVDDADFVKFARAYAEAIVPQASPLYDLDADQHVSDADFVLFATSYSQLICE